MLEAPTTTIIVLVVRLFLGAFLLRSAWSKLVDLRAFVTGVRDYQLLPTWAARSVGFTLPWLELGLALGLLLGVAMPVVSGITALLLVGFIGAIVVNLRRGRQISCHCHGSAHHEPISGGTIARNTLLLGLTLVLLRAPMVHDGRAWAALWRNDLSTLATLPVALITACLFVFCMVSVPLVAQAVALQGQLGGRRR